MEISMELILSSLQRRNMGTSLECISKTQMLNSFKSNLRKMDFQESILELLEVFLICSSLWEVVLMML